MTFEEALNNVPPTKEGTKVLYSVKDGEWYSIYVCNADDPKNWDRAWGYFHEGWGRAATKNSRQDFDDFFLTEEEAVEAAFLQKSLPIPTDWEIVEVQNYEWTSYDEEWNGRDGEGYGTCSVKTTHRKVLAVYEDGEEFELRNPKEGDERALDRVYYTQKGASCFLLGGKYAVEAVEEDETSEYFVLHKVIGDRYDKRAVKVRIK